MLSHSTLIGNLPGFVASQNWFPQPSDIFWSPAGWAWTGGLMNSLLPTLYFGRPIVATPGKFSAARRSEEHTSELQSLMRISYAVFCLQKKTTTHQTHPHY